MTNEPDTAAPPARRLRVAHLVIQPVLVWDDGENLAPGPEAEATAVPLVAVGAFCDDLLAQIADRQ